MNLNTLKDGDTIYINNEAYTFHKVIDEVPYMRCAKVENDVPILIKVKE